MKVYIGYHCHYDGCDVFRSVKKVFDDEVKALCWEEEFESSDYEWREYVEMEVE